MIILKQKAKLLESDVATPVSVFLERLGNRKAGLLLESAELGGRWGRYSLVGEGALLTLSCQKGLLEIETVDPRMTGLLNFSGLPYLEGLKKVIRELSLESDPNFPGLPPITRALYGYLGYGLAGMMEPVLAKRLPPESAEAVMLLPHTVLLFDHLYNKLFEITLGGAPLNLPIRPQFPTGPDIIVTNPLREQYLSLVRSAKEMIAQGELIQIVLSVGFEKPLAGHVFDVYRRLRRLNPSSYMFYLQLPQICLAVSSPETLISCQDNRLRLCPIAGTRPRGQDKLEDDLFEAELATDFKERAEHVMLVDLGRNDLGRVAKPASVEVVRFMDVERFSHVMHLTSSLAAELAPCFDVLDVTSAAFPAGTLSGAPKIRAMELIADLEMANRGPYGGAIGWLGLDRDQVNLDLGIAIRGLWARDGRAYWRAGGGVVYDSDPAREWAECLNKAAVVRQALENQDN
ncbi:MAG: anthranilate synthase component I family protein [Deltaproteobacteria bacterium]|jgi:anthranilate synthase component 1|nr:anthranilate synthase component I family protein [Deltaproteobacteria bacterium]